MKREAIKIFCYAQHCFGGSGVVVHAREIDRWFGENHQAKEAGYFCDDWDLVAEGTLAQIRADLTRQIAVMEAGRVRDSNDVFALRQIRNAMAVVS